MASFITVKVQARSSRPGVEQLAEHEFKVRVSAAPEKGRANREVLRLLADHLGLPPSRLTIVRGGTSSSKTIKVEP